MSNKGQVLTRDLTLLVLVITASRNGATSAKTQRLLTQFRRVVALVASLRAAVSRFMSQHVVRFQGRSFLRIL